MIPEQAVEAAAKFMQAVDAEEGFGNYPLREYTEHAAAILKAAAPHMLAGLTIATEEELDELPAGSVVLSVVTLHHEGGWPIAYQRWQDGDWHRGGRASNTHPDNFLPATILHRPAK